MKAAALANAFDDFPEIHYEIIHSGQHYDANMSAAFFEEFQLKEPLYNFHIGSKAHNIFLAEFLVHFDAVLVKHEPDMILVVGDTNTTSAAAIAAAKRNVPIAHVEAGLREWNKAIPEEINKLLTDAVTDLYFTPTATGIENLEKQGITEQVYLTGDITLDLLRDNRYIWDKQKTLDYFQLPDQYIILTCHRAATTADESLLREIVDAANTIDIPIVWPLHPRTKNALIEYQMLNQVKAHIRLVEPLNYTKTQSLIKHAYMAISDSGGIIKESYFHRTPTIIIDNQTEWLEAIAEGWHVIAGPNKSKILEAYHEHKAPDSTLQSFGTGESGLITAKAILAYLSK